MTDQLSQICDLPMLKVAAMLSLMAYGELPAAVFVDDKKTSTQAYLVRGEKFDVIVFRGSKEPTDFLIDLLAIPWKYGRGWCHHGFAKAHSRVWPKFLPLIKKNHPLLVTGHSLGGALAEKSCDFLEGFMEADVHMVTFGKPNVHLKCATPRLGYLKTQLSVVSGSDAIARSPRFLYGPDSGQDMLYLANDGNDYINPDADFRREDRHLFDIISDHSMALYIKRIKMILEAKV